MYVKVRASGRAEVSPSPTLNKSLGLGPSPGLAQAGLFWVNLRAGSCPSPAHAHPYSFPTLAFSRCIKRQDVGNTSQSFVALLRWRFHATAWLPRTIWSLTESDFNDVMAYTLGNAWLRGHHTKCHAKRTICHPGQPRIRTHF